MTLMTVQSIRQVPRLCADQCAWQMPDYSKPPGRRVWTLRGHDPSCPLLANRMQREGRRR